FETREIEEDLGRRQNGWHRLRLHLDALLLRRTRGARLDARRWAHLILGHGYLLLKRAAMMRAPTVTRNVTKTSVNAAPHARSCAATNDEFALAKICIDNAVLACSKRCGLYSVAAPTAKSKGAVSPAAQATASSEPERMPGSAAGRTTVRIVRLL